MRLIIIRHGQTTGDIEDRYGGAYDDALSEEGARQAAELAQDLASKGIAQIFSSPLIRAQQTAQALAAVCGAPIETIADLRERDQYGRLTGITKAEAKAQHPEWVELLKDRLNTLPDAESYTAASARTRAAYAEVLAQAAGHECAAIVWHGGGMRVLFRDILQLGELDHIGDCCWVELDYTAAGVKVLESRRIEFGFNA